MKIVMGEKRFRGRISIKVDCLYCLYLLCALYAGWKKVLDHADVVCVCVPFFLGPMAE